MSVDGDATGVVNRRALGSPLAKRTAAFVIGGIFVAILMGALDQYVVLTALPNIATSLGDSNGVAFVVSAYLISAAVGIPVFGRLADMYSRRDVFLAGLATFVAGSALAGFSQNLTELIAFRAFQGVASGAFIVVGFAIVAALFPPETRARVAGIFTGTFVIATIAGPLLGSFIVDHSSWRWVFFVNLPIALAAAALLGVSLGPLIPERRGRFDLGGAALLTGWVSAVTVALVQHADSGWAWSDVRLLGLLASAVVLLAGFILWESRVHEPLIPLRAFGRRMVASSSAVAFLRGIALVTLYTYLAIYVGLVLLHDGPGAADRVRDVLYFLVVPAVVGAGLGSQLVTRATYRTLAGVGMGLAAFGTALLTTVSTSTPLWVFAFGFVPVGGLVIPLIPIGFGIGLTFPVTLLAAQFAVPRHQVGAATSIIQFLSTFGGAIGVSLLTAFQEWRLAALTPNATAPFESIREVFVILLGLLVVAFAVSLLMTGRLPRGADPRRVEAGEPEPTARPEPTAALPAWTEERGSS